MKSAARCLAVSLLLFVAGVRAQTPPPCSTFDNNTLNGWTPQFTLATVQTAGHPSPYADLRDQSGGSNFIAPPTFNGNWIAYAGGCGQLCFEINAINDGLATSNPERPQFTIFDNSTGKSATFRMNGIVEGSGWRTVCAPIGPLDSSGNLPSNGQGNWVFGTNTTAADWQNLITNVQGFRFSVDYASAGAQTEQLQLDNICFRPASCARAEFTMPNMCAGGQSAPVNQSVGATSSSWTFPGGNPASSTATAPSVSYAIPGTYPITLCINGGSAAPLCVTHNITVIPGPTVPAINGPDSACQKPATYCVAAQAGVTYTWAITPATAGTIVSTTATCATINWNGPAGVVIVTATNAQGCRAQRHLEVRACPTSPCCPNPTFRVDSTSLVRIGPAWVFQPVISAPSARRVVVDIIRASTTRTGGVCPAVPAFAPVITAVRPTVAATPLVPMQTVPNSFEAIWQGTAVPLAGIRFPMDVQIPNLGPNCADTVNLCVKYTVSDGECRTCERIECYSFGRNNIIDDPTVSTSTAVN